MFHFNEKIKLDSLKVHINSLPIGMLSNTQMKIKNKTKLSQIQLENCKEVFEKFGRRAQFSRKNCTAGTEKYVKMS